MKIDDFHAIVIDMEGEIVVCRNETLDIANNIAEVSGDKLVLTDFQNSQSFAMTVAAPEKYIVPVLDKKMQEEGLTEGPSKILVHATNAYDSSLSHASFTAVPADIYASYEERVMRDDDLQVHCSINAILHAQVRALKIGEPVACLFVHGSHVDLVVGDAIRVYSAMRLSVFEGENQRDLMCDSVISALREVERESKKSIVSIYVNYFQPKCLGSISRGITRLMGVNCEDFECEEYKFHGQSYIISLKAMLAPLELVDTNVNGVTKLQYLAKRVTPLAAMVLSGIMLALVAISFVWQDETNVVQAKAAKIRHAFEQDQVALGTLQSIREESSFKEALSLARSLRRAQLLPSMQDVLSDISYASRSSVLVDHISLDYQKDNLQVQVSGQIKASFGTGLEAYSNLISEMKKKGYALIDKKMDMDMKVNTFVLQLERHFDKKQA